MNENTKEIKNRILGEQVRILFSLSKNALLTTFLVGIFVCLVLLPIFEKTKLYIWFITLCVIISLRYLLTLFYEKHKTKNISNSNWLKLFAIGSTLTGFMWGIASTIFFPVENPFYQPMICIMVLGMTAGAVPFLSSVPLIYILFSLPSLLPFAFYMIYLKGNTYTILGFSTLLYVIMNVISSLRVGNTISSNIKMSMEKGFLIEDLKIAKSEAEKANKAKSVFISSISHELRTPLNAILGYSQLLENSTENLSADIKDDIQEINHAGTHLLDLIDDVLDLSKIEAGLLELDIKSIDIGNVIHKCKTLITPTAQKEGIQVEVINKSKTPLIINADLAKIRQVILNILSNAIKYNRLKGRVTIILSKNHDNLVKIAITDTGKGISEQNIKDVFTPFNRLGIENSTIPGTGLGLAISKKLVNLMNGEISVTSKEGIGTTFLLTFSSSDGEDLVSPETKIINAGEIITGMKESYSLLYIEDNQTNIKLLEKVLKKLRPSVTYFYAETGYEGLKFAEELEPDVILCDIQLPDITGFEIAKQLKTNPKFKDTAIIALSAEANKEIIERSLESGFFSYQTKPFQINNLLDTLDKASKKSDSPGKIM